VRGTYYLSIPGNDVIAVGSASQLTEQLSAIQALSDGAIVTLEKDRRDYIKAKASNGLWEVWRRRGGWWTKQSFSAWLSNEWSERAARTKFSFLRMFSTRDQLRFSTPQMVALFAAHLTDEKYPYPYMGAD
jgi:hypothetical protein